MTTIWRIEVARQAGRVAVLADVDVLALRAVEACPDDLLHATADGVKLQVAGKGRRDLLGTMHAYMR